MKPLIIAQELNKTFNRQRQNKVKALLLRDRDIYKFPERFLAGIGRGFFGFVFQQFNLLRNPSVLDNILLPLTLSDLNQKEKTIIITTHAPFVFEHPLISRRLSMHDGRLAVTDTV